MAYKKIVFLLLGFAFTAHAQDMTKVRAVIDTLASTSMQGRNATFGGDSLAADYIRAQFTSLGLKSFTSDYYQAFYYDVNLFPGAMEVKVNNKPLVPGRDFIVDPACPSINGTFTFSQWNASLIEKGSTKKQLNQNKRKALGIGGQDMSLIKKYPSAYGSYGLRIVSKSKLTWSVARQQSPYNALLTLQDSIYTKLKEGNQVQVTIESKFVPKHRAVNVLGYIKGESSDSLLVFTAHYDHLGCMGKGVIFPGASDNASGVAMVLALAEYFSLPENKPKYDMAFIAFAGEEAGLLGSMAFVENPLFELKKVKALINLDLMGGGEEGITIVNGEKEQGISTTFRSINTEKNYMANIALRANAPNSDHYHFVNNGVPAVFIYTRGSVKAYHDIYDRPEDLKLTAFANLFGLLRDFGVGY
jgi:aminopeptidase YwaD